MNYQNLALQFLNISFEINKQSLQKSLDESMKGERFVMYYLYTNNNIAFSSEISDKMNISSARVAAILNKLEEKQFIVRSIDKEDRRRVLISLTDIGIKETEIAQEKIIMMVSKMFKQLGENDSLEFVRIFKKMSEIACEFERI